MQKLPSAFTQTYATIQKRLVNESKIRYDGKEISVVSLWDTGASCSCISHDVVKTLGLIRTGVVPMKTPSGESLSNTYLVDIELPNNVEVKQMQVCETEIGNQGLGLLIGMDIITMGDFSVSNYNGKTVFSFCLPSLKTTDYARQITARNIIGTPHGVKTGRKKNRNQK